MAVQGLGQFNIRISSCGINNRRRIAVMSLIAYVVLKDTLSVSGQNATPDLDTRANCEGTSRLSGWNKSPQRYMAVSLEIAYRKTTSPVRRQKI